MRPRSHRTVVLACNCVTAAGEPHHRRCGISKTHAPCQASSPGRTLSITRTAPDKALIAQRCHRYFRRLQLRYTHVAQPRAGNAGSRLTPAQRADSRGYPVAIVNLLRKGSMDKDRSEAKLYAAFCALLTALAKECGMNVINIGLDWHDLAATHGDLAPVVQILWAAAEARYREFGFTQGRLEAAAGGTQRAPTGAGEGGGSGSDGQVTTPWGETMQAVRQRRQRGVCRFNCADSLDRTNVASYYSAFQVLHNEPGMSWRGHDVLRAVRLPLQYAMFDCDACAALYVASAYAA